MAGNVDLKHAAARDAGKGFVGCQTNPCVLGKIVAYDREGHYIGTKPPSADKAYLSAKAVVDAHRLGEQVELGPIVASRITKYLWTHTNLLYLAAVSYGEAWYKTIVYEEMAGIAYVLLRQMKLRNCNTIQELSRKYPNLFYADKGKNPRFNAFKSKRLTLVDLRERDEGMRLSIKGAINALLGGHDYSNGAYFWDGIDLATNYRNHTKINAGFLFTRVEHSMFHGGNTCLASHPKSSHGKQIYSYTYETTAAHGRTVFSKLTQEFMDATGGKQGR